MNAKMALRDLMQQVKAGIGEFVALSQQMGYGAEESSECIQDILLQTVEDTLAQRRAQCQELGREVAGIQHKLLGQWACLGLDGLDSQAMFRETSGLALFEQRARLGELLAQTKAQKQQRKEEIAALWNKYNRLARKLGREPTDFAGKKQLSDAAVAAVQQGIAELTAEYQQLIADVKQQCLDIAEQFRVLELEPDRNQPLHRIVFSEYSDDFHCDELVSHLQEIRALEQELRALRKQRKAQALLYAQEIVLLWDVLSVPSEHQENFFDQNRGLGEGVVLSCSRELFGLRERRAGQLEEQKNRIVKDLERLWSIAFKSKSNGYPKLRKKELLDRLDQLLSPPAEQACIAGVQPVDKCRASLADRIKRLEQAVHMLDAELAVVVQELSRPIVALIEKRRALLVQKEQLAALEKDPSRLSSRKGNLIQETALRTQVAKLKPVEKEIIKKCQEFVESIGQPFLYQGENYIEVIERDREPDRPAARDRDRVSVAARSAVATPTHQQPAARTARPLAARDSSCQAAAPTPRTPGVRKTVPAKPSIGQRSALYIH